MRSGYERYINKVIIITLIYFILILHWGSGAVVRALASHQCGPGLSPSWDTICGLIEFVAGSLPYCRRNFFSGYSNFSLSSKTSNSKFQIDLEGLEFLRTPKCFMGKQIKITVPC